MGVQIIQAEEELLEGAGHEADGADIADADHALWDGVKEAKAAGLPPRTVLFQNGTVELTLRDQLDVTVGSTVTPYQKILFGRLKGKHMKDLVKTGQEDFLPRAMSHSTGLTQPRANLLLDEMDAADQRAVSQVIRFLQGAGDQIGR